VKDLNKHIDKYQDEIARLLEEKEQVVEKVEELEALINKRDEEIAEMESLLKEKEKFIG
jgi:peptidoglycan hydrolase CwlO-like protein